MSETNGYVGADYFLKPFQRRYRDVVLPGGAKARIRNLTEREKTEYEQSQFDLESRRMRPDARIVLICLCLVGGDDKPLFPIVTKEVRAHFAALDAAITDGLEDAIRDHCGLTEAGRRALQSDFPETPAAVSSSA